MFEIEKKYLLHPTKVDELINTLFVDVKKEKIKQFYIQIDENQEQRLRKVNNNFFYTQKIGQGEKREEIEKEIGKEEFKILSKNRISKFIKKTRYIYFERGLKYCIDIFKNNLEGLFILEVEFSDDKIYKEFVLPKFYEQYISKEVTNDERYKNKNLSLLGIPPSEEVNFEQTIERIEKGKFQVNQLFLDRHTPSINAFGALFFIFLSNIKNSNIANTQHSPASDPKLLHNFRVISRKIKSLMKEANGIYDNDILENLYIKLKEIVKKTNTTRDLDVFIEHLKEHEKDILHKIKLVELEKKLFIEKVKLSEEVIIAIKDFDSFCEEFSIFIMLPNMYGAKNSKSPIYFTVKNSLSDILEKIEIKFNTSQSDEDFHKLRIYFKRVRYLLEMFGSLFKKKKIESLLVQLVSLQENLGRFWDITNQINMIFEYEYQENLDELVVLLEGKKELLKDPIMKEVSSFLTNKEKIIKYLY